MSAQSALYTMSDPDFFESPTSWEYDHSAFFLTAEEAPTGWTKRVSDVWQHMEPCESTLPDQGWKVHVSATPKNAEEILKIVSDFCFGTETAFKFLRTRRLVEIGRAHV